MRFDPARLSLIPAFLLLVVLVVVAMCHTAGNLVPMGEIAGIPSAEELAIPPLGFEIHRFAAAHPIWAHILGGFMLMVAAMSLGRLTARYKLYGSGTMLAIPLYALMMLSVVGCEGWFHAILTSTLYTFSIKNCCYANRSGFSFDNHFRGAMYLALLLLIAPKAFPLILILPVAAWQFRRTTRENIVTICGLLLPFATLCYLNWALGGDFTAPMVALYHLAIAGEWFSGILATSLVGQLYIGVLLFICLMAFGLFHTNSYTLSTRSRQTLLFISKALPITTATLLVAGANTTFIGLLAIPATLLLPVLFIRTRRPIANTLLALIVVAALAARYFGI